MDGLAIVRAKPAEGALVAIERLPADHLLDGRRPGPGDAAVQNDLLSALTGALRQRSDPVQDGGAEVGLQGAVVLGREVLEATQGRQQRVLHEIAGIAEVAGPGREPAAGPSLEARPVAPDQLLLRRGLPLLHSLEEDQGGHARAKVLPAGRWTPVDLLIVHQECGSRLRRQEPTAWPTPCSGSPARGSRHGCEHGHAEKQERARPGSPGTMRRGRPEAGIGGPAGHVAAACGAGSSVTRDRQETICNGEQRQQQ